MGQGIRVLGEWLFLGFSAVPEKAKQKPNIQIRNSKSPCSSSQDLLICHIFEAACLPLHDVATSVPHSHSPLLIDS